MLRLHCPYCNSLRDEDEFTYGGPLNRVRPPAPAALSDEAWAGYLFTRENPRGHASERWRHTYGCRQWFAVERDTVSHKVLHTAPLRSGTPPPGETTSMLARGIHETA